jgi:anti-sigma regulatory factor (Ser/Thr protein kinase)
MSEADRRSNGGGPAPRLARSQPPPSELGELAEFGFPTSARAPGAARMVIAHCLSGLVAPRVIKQAELLVSELVTNSLDHGQLDDRDTVWVRIYLGSGTLRLEIENAGTAGDVAPRRGDRSAGRGGFGLELVDLIASSWGVKRSRNTVVWFEMAPEAL